MAARLKNNEDTVRNIFLGRSLNGSEANIHIKIKRIRISLLYLRENGRSAAVKQFIIDTGTDEQQLIAANPVSRAVLL